MSRSYCDAFTLLIEEEEWDCLITAAKERAWWRDAYWVSQWE